MEQITGYHFFSNLPLDVQAQLKARRTDRFINGASLLADNTLMSSEILPFQSGESVNLSIGQSDSNDKLINDIFSQFGNMS